MAYLDYPRWLYRFADDGTPIEDSKRLVKNADQEADAKADGYDRLPAPPPVDELAAQQARPEFLDYPRWLYLGGKASDADSDKRYVKNADQEAEAVAEGYLRLGAKPDEQTLTDELAALSAKDAVLRVAQVDDVDALQAAADVDTRATVQKAIEKRLIELAHPSE